MVDDLLRRPFHLHEMFRGDDLRRLGLHIVIPAVSSPGADGGGVGGVLVGGGGGRTFGRGDVPGPERGFLLLIQRLKLLLVLLLLTEQLLLLSPKTLALAAVGTGVRHVHTMAAEPPLPGHVDDHRRAHDCNDGVREGEFLAIADAKSGMPLVRVSLGLGVDHGGQEDQVAVWLRQGDQSILEGRDIVDGDALESEFDKLRGLRWGGIQSKTSITEGTVAVRRRVFNV